MLRRVFTLLLLFAAAPAAAQTFMCPRMQIGWSKQWPTSQITSAAYDSGAKVLYIIQAHTIPEAYAQVPTSVMSQFSSAQDPYQVYLSVRAQYPQMLLKQGDNCPIFATVEEPFDLQQENDQDLLQENYLTVLITPYNQVDDEYVYTNTVPLNYFMVLLKEDRGPLLQETGKYILLTTGSPLYIPYLGLAQETKALIVQENYGPIGITNYLPIGY